jgi:NADPH2:quinone reductase
MKAIRVREFGGPEVMKVEEIPDPKPGPGEVLVRVKAVAVNPVDTYIRSGAYGNSTPLPYTPGSDAGGTVEAVGDGVKGVKPGDRVYTSGTTAPGPFNGAYGELCVSRVAQVHPLPASLSFVQGAAVNIPYATSFRALFHRARAQAGETVLIHGASGGVGVAAVQIARAYGLRVIGTGGTDRGRTLVQEQGAHHVLDHKQADYLQKLMDLTEGRGVDVILEMAAHVNLGKDLTVLAKGGRVVVIGSRGPIEINPRDTMSRDASIHGVALINASPAEVASLHAALGAGLANGSLRPVIGKELPLKEAPAAHQTILQPGAYAKIVLIP